MKLFNKENLFVRQPVTRKFALTKINASVSMQGTSKNKRKCLGHYDIRESVLIPNRSCEKMNVVDIIIIRCYSQHKIFRADHIGQLRGLIFNLFGVLILSHAHINLVHIRRKQSCRSGSLSF